MREEGNEGKLPVLDVIFNINKGKIFLFKLLYIQNFILVTNLDSIRDVFQSAIKGFI